MLKILIGVVIGALIVGAYFGVNVLDIWKGDQPKEIVNQDVTSYFKERVEERFTSEVGQPIEGFEPFMFLQVWTGLKKEDFNGVEALQGKYSFEGEELVFEEILSGGDSPHSASKSISEVGFLKLLTNLSERLKLEIKDKKSIDKLLEKIG